MQEIKPIINPLNHTKFASKTTNSLANHLTSMMVSLGILRSTSLAIEFHVSLEIFHLSFLLIDDLLLKLWLMCLLRLIVDLLLKLALRFRADALSFQWIINSYKGPIVSLFDHTIFVQMIAELSVSFFLFMHLLLFLSRVNLEGFIFCQPLSNF